MTDEQIKEMILDIVKEIDYDILKDCYQYSTAEYPDEVEDNTDALVKIVRRHLSNSTG